MLAIVDGIALWTPSVLGQLAVVAAVIAAPIVVIAHVRFVLKAAADAGLSVFHC